MFKIKDFIKEVKGELIKASWPWDPREKGMKKYKELVDSTLLVVVAMLLFAGFVGIWDFLMMNISSLLTYLATK